RERPAPSRRPRRFRESPAGRSRRSLHDFDIAPARDPACAPRLGIRLVVGAGLTADGIALDASLVAGLCERTARFLGEREADAVAFELHVAQIGDAVLRARRSADELELLLHVDLVFTREADAVVVPAPRAHGT